MSNYVNFENENYLKLDMNDIFNNCEEMTPYKEYIYLNKLTRMLYGYNLEDIEFIDGNRYNLKKSNILFKK